MKKINVKGEQTGSAAAAGKQKNGAVSAAAPKAVNLPKPKSAAKPKAAIKSKPAIKEDQPKAKPVAKPKATPVVKEKTKKPKLVRDSFTMPETEYAVLGEVKKLCLKAGVEVKKSELLRIGVAHIRQLSLTELKKSIASLVPLKAGRPKKEK